MDLDVEKKLNICRLCLKSSDDVVNIWNSFQDSTIASILSKHFWFEIYDGTEWLCQTCWLETKSFHEFYKKVEQFQKCFHDSDKKDATNDDSDAVPEPELIIVKCEQMEMGSETIHSDVNRHKSFNDEKISESETEKSVQNQEDHDFNNELMDDEIPVMLPNVTRKGRLSPSEKVLLDGQIREFFDMKCDICSDSDVKFESLTTARQHYRNIHGRKGYLTCCRRKFVQRHEIVQHIRYHMNPDSYRCDECNKSFKNEKMLKAHIDSHVPHDSREFKCSLCPKSFVKPNKLRGHMRLKHSSNEAFPCDKCGKICLSSSLLSCHFQEVHGFADSDKKHTSMDHGYEETGMRSETHDSNVSRHESFDNGISECETEKDPRDDEIQVILQNVIRRGRLSPIEQIKVDGQIRKFFDMKCDICSDVKFENVWIARQHYRQIHGRKGYLTCCGSKFIQRHQIVNHIRYHIKPDSYRCDQCNKSFKNEKTLKSHCDTHVPLDLREFKCSFCPKSFVKPHKLRGHVRLYHTFPPKTGKGTSDENSEGMLVCDQCGKIFRSGRLLLAHIRQVHELAQEYVCEVCARQFKNKQTFHNHVKYEHSETPPSKVQCDICGAWLKRKACLRNHMIGYHGHSSDTLKCSICRKMVRNEAALNRHMLRNHETIRHCNLCDKAFKCVKQLKKHIAIHTGADPYDCPYCERTFKTSGHLRYHREKMHSAEWSRDRKLPKRSTLTMVCSTEELKK